MEIEEFKEHNELVDFYISRGIEFNDEKQYFHPPLFSYIAKINDCFVGAITICKEDNNFILDEVAVVPEKVKQGVCTALVDTAIKRIKNDYGDSNIYLVAKNSDVFNNMGFKIIEREEAPSFSECFTCPDFQKKCFPRIMIKKINNL